ncbi:MAG: hypothetical protein ACJ8J0_14550 [Longimicrobiaceae bacterium]
MTTRATTTASGSATTATVVHRPSAVPGDRPSAHGDAVFRWRTAALAPPVDETPASRGIQADPPSGGGTTTGVRATTRSYLRACVVGEAAETRPRCTAAPPVLTPVASHEPAGSGGLVPRGAGGRTYTLGCFRGGHAVSDPAPATPACATSFQG